MPKSLDCASAHSRVQPETADLNLWGGPQAFVAVFYIDRHGHTVLHAISTPGAADTGFYRAQGFTVSMSGFKASID